MTHFRLFNFGETDPRRRLINSIAARYITNMDKYDKRGGLAIDMDRKYTRRQYMGLSNG